MVTRLVVRADLWLTAPAVVLQPTTGLALVHLGGWPLTSPWLLVAMGLYLFAGVCWLPVVWLQVRMARQAEAAWRAGQALPESYRRDARRWEALGYPAFVAMLAVVYLMVAKPGF